MCLVAPYENDSIIFELLHCIDFQARNFEYQQFVQLDPKEIKTQILERLKHQKQNSNTRKTKQNNKNHKQ
ncbi:hypothetical protein TH0156_12600 [Helicobacter pylori]